MFHTAGEYRGRLKRVAILGNDRGNHILFPGRTGGRRDSVDEHVIDLRMLCDDLFDEAGVDEITVVADSAAFAVVEVEPALLVAVTHIAATQPAAFGLLL